MARVSGWAKRGSGSAWLRGRACPEADHERFSRKILANEFQATVFELIHEGVGDGDNYQDVRASVVWRLRYS